MIKIRFFTVFVYLFDEVFYCICKFGLKNVELKINAIHTVITNHSMLLNNNFNNCFINIIFITTMLETK